jgi:hypothetical protein
MVTLPVWEMEATETGPHPGKNGVRVGELEKLETSFTMGASTTGLA